MPNDRGPAARPAWLTPFPVRSFGVGHWSFRARRGLLLLGALVLLVHLVLPRPDLRPSTAMLDRYLDGRSLGAHPAQPEPVFRDAATGEPVPAAAGAIFAANDVVRRHFRGTYLGGDAWTGHLYGEPFPVDAPFLYLPVAGYPASAGNGLFVAFSTPGKPDNVLAVRRYEGSNPREAVGLWEIDARPFRGAVATVEMFDGLPTNTGWLGVGRPLLGERGGLGGRGPGDFGDAGGTYGVFWWSALVVAALLWLPGAAWRDWREARRPEGAAGAFTFTAAAWLALPGVLGLTGLGLLLWLTGLGTSLLLGKVYVAAVALAALGAARRPATAAGPGGGRFALAVYAGVVLVVLQFSVVPRSVDRTLTARGPLVPFGVTALFHVFGLVPPDPAPTGELAWPADEPGFFLARIFGVLTNALWVPVVAAVAARAAAPAGRGWRAGALASGWAALGPLGFPDAAFAWPGLLAAAFALLAVAAWRGLRDGAVLATFAGMVLIGGFNADGRGGGSPFVLALGAVGVAVVLARATNNREPGAAVLSVVAVVTGWIMFSGFFLEPRFQAVGLPAARWAQLGALGLTWAGLLALVLAGWRHAVTGRGGNIFGHASGPRRAPAPAAAVPVRRTLPPPRSPAPAPVVGGWQEWPRWAVLVAVAFVVFTRRPDQWLRPQFWAEDALVLFNHAWRDGLASVFRPYPAYFALYQRLVAGIAGLFPTTWAPGLYAVGAMGATLGAAAFILRARLPWLGARGKAFLALALVAVPHGGEVFGTLINTQWLLAPTLWVLILQEPARTRGEAVVDFAMLVLAGLTGPFVVLFAPWFFLRWRRGGWRGRYDFWLVALAVTLAAVQSGAVLQRGPVEHLPASHEVGLWLKAVGFQLPGGLFFGASVPHYLGRAFFLITPVLLLAGAWALARAERGRALAALVVLSGGFLAYAGGMYEVGGLHPDMISPFGPAMRYFYPCYVAAAWAAVFLWHDRSPAVRRAAGLSLLAMLLASASAWTAPALVNFHWSEYARRLDAGEPTVVAPINPAGWTVELQARGRRP